MRCDDDWRRGRPWLGFVFGLVFVVVALVVAFTVVGVVFRQLGAIEPAAIPAWIWSLVELFAVLWIISWVFRFAFGGMWMHKWHGRRLYHHGFDDAGALSILKMKYVNGNLTRAQYLRMKKDLE